MATTLAAEYYPGGQNSHAELVISRIGDGRREIIETILVSGKRAARQIAASMNATCWNF